MLTLTYPDERRWLVTKVRTMGTRGELQIDGPMSLVTAATERLLALEQSWSRFLPDSELEWLHRRAGEWVEVSADLARVLSLAITMHDQTNGWFDPSVRSSLERMGYDRTFRGVADDDRPALPPTPAPGLAGLTVDHLRGMARLAPGLRIDLGGIGKGLAADIIANEAVFAGARAACVGLGGDIAVAGEPPDDRGWDIPITHPATGEVLDRHRLTSGGMAMSTTLLRRWRRAHERYHHLVDPHVGSSSTTPIEAVAVAANSTARAEVLAKSVLIAGPAMGRMMLRRAAVKAWIVTSDRVETLDFTEEI